MIAVIGHGRSPEGKRWGTQIDACATVVRMWDNEWQPFEDYGKVYHYGLFVLTPKGLGLFEKHNKRTPRYGWLAYKGKPMGVCTLPNNTKVIDPVVWTDKAMRMGGVGESGKLTLTRGCVAACWAIEHASTGEPVVLVGFDNVLCGINQPVEKSFCPEYWALYMSRFTPNTDKVYPIGSSKTATHDMNVEFPLLKELARERMVDLQVAEDVWND